MSDRQPVTRSGEGEAAAVEDDGAAVPVGAALAVAAAEPGVPVADGAQPTSARRMARAAVRFICRYYAAVASAASET